MRILIPREKIKEAFIIKNMDGSCVIKKNEFEELDGYVVGLSSNGSYIVETFEEQNNEDRKF